MKVLYATDLHGHKRKYKRLKSLVVKGDYNLLIIGADILPQKHSKSYDFIWEYLHSQFFDEVIIPTIIDFGNDDFYMYYESFKEVVSRFPHVHISHMNRIDIGGYSFVGMHYVRDYPFGRKDWCRRDGAKVSDPVQFDQPMESLSGRIIEFDDLDEWLNEKPSMTEYFQMLPPSVASKTVYLIHNPPKWVGLDLTKAAGAVGSDSITSFIDQVQPFLTLHGHIHESPMYTGVAINKIGTTI